MGTIGLPFTFLKGSDKSHLTLLVAQTRERESKEAKRLWLIEQREKKDEAEEDEEAEEEG